VPDLLNITGSQLPDQTHSLNTPVVQIEDVITVETTLPNWQDISIEKTPPFHLSSPTSTSTPTPTPHHFSIRAYIPRYRPLRPYQSIFTATIKMVWYHVAEPNSYLVITGVGIQKVLIKKKV
jgi:hypothetical protein